MIQWLFHCVSNTNTLSVNVSWLCGEYAFELVRGVNSKLLYIKHEFSTTSQPNNRVECDENRLCIFCLVWFVNMINLTVDVLNMYFISL